MNRRSLLKLLALGVAGHTLDLDRLLWVPNTKTIFIPETPRIYHPTLSEIVAIELERVIPHIRAMFERDDIFYAKLSSHKITKISGVSKEGFRIPLIIKPGEE